MGKMDGCGYSKFKCRGEKCKKRINSNRCIAFSCSSNEKNKFNLFLFLFDAKFCEFWTKEVQKLRVDVKQVRTM